MSKAFRIERTILCDDVRDEVNGKTTLVGVYARELNVPRLPAQLPMISVCVSGYVDVDFDGSLEFRLESPSKRRIASHVFPPPPPGTIIENDTATQIVWRISPIRFDEVGKHRLLYVSDGKEKEILSFKVGENPSLT